MESRPGRGSVHVRTCIGCRQRTDRSHLIRVVAGDGHPVVLVPDPRGRLPGRGAHLHPDPRCLDLAERRRAFGRALRLDGPVDLTQVRRYVEEHAGGPTAAGTDETTRSTT